MVNGNPLKLMLKNPEHKKLFNIFKKGPKQVSISMNVTENGFNLTINLQKMHYYSLNRSNIGFKYLKSESIKYLTAIKVCQSLSNILLNKLILN